MNAAVERAQALIELRRPDQAADILLDALKQAPDEPELHSRLALALIHAGDHRGALRAADAAVRLAPDAEWPHRLRAIALRALKRNKKAVEAATEAVRVAPESASAHEVLADSRLAARDRAGAREAAERARELDPASAGPHHTLGDIALDEGRAAQAERHYRAALELEPGNPDTLNNLAVAVQTQGNEAAAQDLYERAAIADPQNRTARRNLARAARSRVNGWAYVFVCLLLARILATTVDEGVAAGTVAALALAGAIAFFVVRSRRRTRELSPATRRLLADQHWWEKIELTSWRPWFWLIPSPIWLLVAITTFIGGIFEAFDTGWDAWSVGVELFLLGAIAVFGYYSRLWLRRKSWIR